MTQRSVNQDTIDLIKKYEGFAPRPYICPAGKRTIGYGHVILPNEKFDNDKLITKNFAESLMLWDLQKFCAAVDELVTVPLTDNQFGALVSFAYNLGTKNLKDSTLLKKLNDGKHRDAAAQFDRWVYADGRRLEGLMKRREAERELFLKE